MYLWRERTCYIFDVIRIWMLNQEFFKEFFDNVIWGIYPQSGSHLWQN